MTTQENTSPQFDQTVVPHTASTATRVEPNTSVTTPEVTTETTTSTQQTQETSQVTLDMLSVPAQQTQQTQEEKTEDTKEFELFEKYLTEKLGIQPQDILDFREQILTVRQDRIQQIAYNNLMAVGATQETVVQDLEAVIERWQQLPEDVKQATNNELGLQMIYQKILLERQAGSNQQKPTQVQTNTVASNARQPSSPSGLPIYTAKELHNMPKSEYEQKIDHINWLYANRLVK